MNMLKKGLQVMLIGVFLFFGCMKIVGAAEMVTTFDSFGYSAGFRQLTGLVEVVAALCLLAGFWVKPLLNVGGVLILGLTSGAIYSHLFRQQIATEAIAPFVVGLIMLLVLLLQQRLGSRQPRLA